MRNFSGKVVGAIIGLSILSTDAHPNIIDEQLEARKEIVEIAYSIMKGKEPTQKEWMIATAANCYSYVIGDFLNAAQSVRDGKIPRTPLDIDNIHDMGIAAHSIMMKCEQDVEAAFGLKFDKSDNVPGAILFQFGMVAYGAVYEFVKLPNGKKK